MKASWGTRTDEELSTEEVIISTTTIPEVCQTDLKRTQNASDLNNIKKM